jgi:single-strand DNA-binding protein
MSIHIDELVGNATADPELKTTNNGRRRAQFTIIHNFREQDGQGQWQDAAKRAFRCVAYDDLAEQVMERIGKGTRITLSGRWYERTRQYQGETRTFDDLVVESFEVTERVKASVAASAGDAQSADGEF